MTTQKLFYTNYFTPETLQIILGAQLANKQLELNQYNKKYDPVSLVTSKGVLNRTNSILRYVTAGTNLNGQNLQETNQINNWFQFFNTQLYPLLSELYGQIFGEKQADEKKYSYSLAQINKNLKVLDDALKIRTFFVGNSITIIDITLLCFLENLFKLIITENERKKLTNLTRWYTYIRQIPPVIKIYGKKILCCKDAFKIDFNQTTEKKQEPKIQPVKVEKKQQTKSKKNQPTTKTQSQQQIAPSAQGNFKLDDWKREFQNSENKLEAIQNLFNNFEKDHWSIWKIHYQKDESQGKVQYLTQNLANGTLQRLDGLRKTGFGNWGVYGQEGNYQVRGVMMWKGTQISSVWKQHPSFEYHEFTKLNHEDQNDRQLILDYWMEKQSAQGLVKRSSKRLV